MQGMPVSGGITARLLAWLVGFLTVSAGYLYAFPQPNIEYAGMVLLHAFAGVLATLLLVPALIRLLNSGSFYSRIGWVLIAVGAVAGLILIKSGISRSEWNKLYFHIVISLAGVGLLVADWLGRRGTSNSGVLGSTANAARAAVCLMVLAGVGYGAHYVRDSW